MNAGDLYAIIRELWPAADWPLGITQAFAASARKTGLNLDQARAALVAHRLTCKYAEVSDLSSALRKAASAAATERSAARGQSPALSNEEAYARLAEPLLDNLRDAILSHPESSIEAAFGPRASGDNRPTRQRVGSLSNFAAGLLHRKLLIHRGVAPDRFWKPPDPVPFTITDPPPSRIIPGRRP